MIPGILELVLAFSKKPFKAQAPSAHSKIIHPPFPFPLKGSPSTLTHVNIKLTPPSIDATASPYASNYKMETYITSELPSALYASFPSLDSSRVSIFGHSMGGHGALTLFLKKPGMYKSVSAFAPISNPVNCPWGEKAFTGYLGEDRDGWKAHDATELVKKWNGELDVLIDVVCF
jgi:pimeloyl-ACP methyl ester carboxylesterase